MTKCKCYFYDKEEFTCEYCQFLAEGLCENGIVVADDED